MSRLGNIDRKADELLAYSESREWWWGALAAPDSKNAIERNVNRPFTCVSGNNTWGPVIQVIGARDDPGPKGTGTYHIHRVQIATQSTLTAWRIRLFYGVDTLEEAVQAQRWTEIMHVTAVAVPGAAGGANIPVKIPSLPSRASSVWAQAWNATNLATVEFFVGCHGDDPLFEFVPLTA